MKNLLRKRPLAPSTTSSKVASSFSFFSDFYFVVFENIFMIIYLKLLSLSCFNYLFKVIKVILRINFRVIRIIANYLQVRI